MIWRCIGQGLLKRIMILKDFCSQKIIVLQSHDEMETYTYWHRDPPEWEIVRGNLKRKESKRWLSDILEWR